MPGSMPDESLRVSVRILESEGVPYFFGGELAVRVWGLLSDPRFLEVMLAADAGRLARLVGRLEQEGFLVPPTTPRGWIDQAPAAPAVCVTRRDGERVWEMGLFLAENPFRVSALERRRRQTIDGVELWLASPEDLLLNLLQIGSPRTLVQAVEIVTVTHPIDLNYLRRWAKTLDVEFQLGEVLERAKNFE
jgi:hypothetical protein